MNRNNGNRKGYKTSRAFNWTTFKFSIFLCKCFWQFHCISITYQVLSVLVTLVCAHAFWPYNCNAMFVVASEYIRINSFTDDSRFKVDKDSAWNVFSRSGFTEESVERVVTTSDRFVAWHLTVRLNTMLQTVQLPTGVANLTTGLADVAADTFTLQKLKQDHHHNGVQVAQRPRMLC